MRISEPVSEGHAHITRKRKERDHQKKSHCSEKVVDHHIQHLQNRSRPLTEHLFRVQGRVRLQRCRNERKDTQILK